MKDAEAFFALARERYSIKLRRESGERPPWTADRLLRDYHFCNVFRDDDKTTALVLEIVRLGADPPWLSALVCRLINRVDGILPLLGGGKLASDWEGRILSGAVPLNTAAYRINTPLGLASRAGICSLIRAGLSRSWPAWAASLRGAFAEFLAVGLGPFIAHQAALDLRGSPAMQLEPEDAHSWAHPGPGAIRGLMRLAGADFSAIAAAMQIKKENGRSSRPTSLQNAFIRRAYRELFGLGPRGSLEESLAAGVSAVLSASREADFWPPEWRVWDAETAQGWLCEYDKYKRFEETGPGNARRFRPPEEQSTLFAAEETA